ncbi:Ig-like domain-containing protein [Terriglobus roseus]|uniref:Ig-like domain (Group 3) n=1 Tax=Terriglobus roseus TaxID=392734 RepID=A0A1G7KSA0_9BACT|nr:Ig-like domain-containing protein [Terriglobus roseus]SDF40093.1 Ig-like domain (group 3) [Terriglobus roseus]
MRNKLNQWGIAKILLAVAGLCLPPLANAQLTPTGSLSGLSPKPVSRFSDVYSGTHFHVVNGTAGSTAKSNTIAISANGGVMLGGGQEFSLTLPADADTNTITATLNGRDVSSRFRGTSGYVSASDGLSTVKNVLNVSVKTSSGGMASGRWRSMTGAPRKSVNATQTPKMMATANAAGVVRSQAEPDVPVNPVCDPVAMCPAWLAPSVRFDTLMKGNWNGSGPWLAVNGVGYGGPTTGTIQAQYVLLAVNRQTLAYEDFEWFSSGGGAAVTSYVKSKNYTSNDLVIVGTGAGASALDSGLDMTSIGGTNWANYPSNQSMPSSYMIIGYGGAAAGSIYENWGPVGAYATGSLLEDANGNYNFQSSDIIEFAIEPNDPGYNSQPTVRLTVPTDQAIFASPNTETQLILPAIAPPNQNGIWMLTLDRENPMPAYQSCSGGTDIPSNSARVVTNCGQFFQVGIGGQNIDGEWSALAAAINAVPYNKLLILQSIGSVGSNSQQQTVTNGGWSGAATYTGFKAFTAALNGWGGTPYAIAGPTYTNQDNYAFVGYQGGGNALTGATAELSTAFTGQMGVLHGTLQRNSNGYYLPAQNSAEQQGLFNAKGGISDSDFLLSMASYQQPVEWPSNSGTVLLPNASSLAGQQAAYRFISHWLLGGYYVKTIQGPHVDDLHYFFTGSVNTSIDYHTMDPANLQFPGVGAWNTFGCTASDGSTCTFTATGDSASSSFTSADFNAVKAQLSLEVIYLTNTLQYLVTGSANMKDIVAAGNANVGLALSAAANTVEGSGMGNLNAQEIATKNVTFSWQSLLGSFGGLLSIAANVEGFGELTPIFDANSQNWKDAKYLTSLGNALGAIISTIGSGGSISSKNTVISSSPQPFAQLTTTVGQLATADLQSPLLAGFDSTVDNITADWGRLSIIGPRTTTTNDSTFFAPNQVQQVAAINGMTSASARGFYFALLPTVYNLHYWRGVEWAGASSGAFSQPTVGSIQDHDEADSCNAFYLTANQPPGSGIGQLSQYQSVAYFSPGGTEQPFGQDEGFYDFAVIDGVASKAGSQSVNITVIDSDLANNLFAPNQLNVPMYQMFSVNGPMASVTYDASASNPSGWGNGSICDASDHNAWPGDVSGGLLGSAPGGNGGAGKKLLTTTSVTSPSSGVLGHDAAFTAQVMTGGQPVTSGSVYISVDGAVVGNPAIGTGGTATWTVPGGLALGKHQIQADYAPGSGYEGSSAQPATYTVYSESADILISMASTSMNATYTSTSAPVSMQINSVAGLAGNVVLSCTGLPAGLACSFDSQSLNLAADGSVNATVQIGPSSASPTSQTSMALLFLPILGLGCCAGFDRNSSRRLVVAIIAICLATVTLTGCAGSSMSSTPTTTRETGLKTITVNASVGSVSRSMGISVNIQ